MISLVLAVAFCQHAEVIDVGTAVLVPRESAVPVSVVGGAWLSDAQTFKLSRERATLKAENESLRLAPPAAKIVVLVFVVGAATGAIVGTVAYESLRQK